MKPKALTRVIPSLVLIMAMLLPVSGINQTSRSGEDRFSSKKNIDTKPYSPEDLPRGVWDFEEMYYVDQEGNRYAHDKTIFFEFGEFFVYQKNKNGEFTTYLINADKLCEGTYENGTLKKVSFSVILWDTPIERVFNIHYLPTGKIDKVTIEYPEEEVQTKQAIYVNKDA